MIPRSKAEDLDAEHGRGPGPQLLAQTATYSTGGFPVAIRLSESKSKVASDLARSAGFESATRCLEGTFGGCLEVA